MQIKTIHSKHEFKTAEVTIKEIAESKNRNGIDMVYLNCEGGDCYSNFKSTWNKQNVSASDLEAGDRLEITYVTKKWNGKDYKNFVKVRFLNRPSVVNALKKLEQEKPNETPDDVENLIDGIVF